MSKKIVRIVLSITASVIMLASSCVPIKTGDGCPEGTHPVHYEDDNGGFYVCEGG